MSLVVNDLAYAYAASGRGCRDVSFTVGTGEIAALVGPSGCGKSTALACVAGVLTGSSGTVSVSGVDEPVISLALHSAPLFEGLRLWENVALAWGYPSKRRQADAITELAAVGLGDHGEAFPSTMSAGQRQRAAVAVALAQRGDVMLFDEPTGNLDDVNASRVLQALRMAADQGCVVVLATHDRRVTEHVDSVIRLTEQAS